MSINKLELSTSTIEKIKYYVYILIDPRNGEIFYVGKGKGNRINDHIKGFFIEKKKETEKNRKIEEIIKSGNKVKQIVIKHGLEFESEAFNIECAIIDLLQWNGYKLTNIVKGHGSEDSGIMDLEDIKIKYEAEEANFDNDKIILININIVYKKSMSYEEIYEATRKSWVVSPARANNATIICAVYKGIIRKVFVIDNSWKLDYKRCQQNPTLKLRYMFEGVLAGESIRDKYLNKSVKKYWKKGAQGPIKYINI